MVVTGVIDPDGIAAAPVSPALRAGVFLERNVRKAVAPHGRREQPDRFIRSPAGGSRARAAARCAPYERTARTAPSVADVAEVSFRTRSATSQPGRRLSTRADRPPVPPLPAYAGCAIDAWTRRSQRMDSAIPPFSSHGSRIPSPPCGRPSRPRALSLTALGTRGLRVPCFKKVTDGERSRRVRFRADVQAGSRSMSQLSAAPRASSDRRSELTDVSLETSITSSMVKTGVPMKGADSRRVSSSSMFTPCSCK